LKKTVINFGILMVKSNKKIGFRAMRWFLN
jgi:hypothetical protein